MVYLSNQLTRYPVSFFLNNTDPEHVIVETWQISTCNLLSLNSTAELPAGLVFCSFCFRPFLGWPLSSLSLTFNEWLWSHYQPWPAPYFLLSCWFIFPLRKTYLVSCDHQPSPLLSLSETLSWQVGYIQPWSRLSLKNSPVTSDPNTLTWSTPSWMYRWMLTSSLRGKNQSWLWWAIWKCLLSWIRLFLSLPLRKPHCLILGKWGGLRQPRNS